MDLGRFLQSLVLLWSCQLGSPQSIDEIMQSSAPDNLSSPRARSVQQSVTSADSGISNTILRGQSHSMEEDTEEGGTADQEDEDNFSSTAVASTVISPTLMTEIEWIRQRQTMRERSRQLRLRNFQHNILRSLGFPNPPTINSDNRETALSQLPSQYNQLIPTAAMPEDRLCYLASCEVPKSTNQTLWESETQPGLRLHFDLPRLARQGDQQIRSASLKLFVKPRKDCPCSEEDLDALPRLLVTAYQFIRPLSIRKRNRVVYRRRLLDAVMIPGQGNLWVSLDIKPAVTTWMTRSRRNFGLEVTIKDVNETLVSAGQHLVHPSCSSVHSERTCRDDNGEAVEEMPWTPVRIHGLVVLQNTPYVDVVLVERSTFEGVSSHRRQQNLRRRRRRMAELSWASLKASNNGESASQLLTALRSDS